VEVVDIFSDRAEVPGIVERLRRQPKRVGHYP
jgi:hypothetical protein